MTDQHKGLDKAIKNLLPMSQHRYCVRHIYANFRKTHSGAELKSRFWEACKCGTPEEFEDVMGELAKIDKAAYGHLMKQKPETWARAYFGKEACSDAVENNMCEAFNGTIIEARCKTLIYMLEDIRLTVMVRMQKRRDAMKLWDDVYCPKTRFTLEKNKKEHRFWSTTYSGNNQFEVKNGPHGYVVDLNEKTCSCRLWELNGIPCPHSVSAIYYMKDDPDKYVSDWYKVERIQKSYGFYMKPLNGEKMWKKQPYDKMDPPENRRMPGRPKKQRHRESHEADRRNSSEISRRGRQMKCGKCGQYGHNKKTCKGPPSVSPSLCTLQLSFYLSLPMPQLCIFVNILAKSSKRESSNCPPIRCNRWQA